MNRLRCSQEGAIANNNVLRTMSFAIAAAAAIVSSTAAAAAVVYVAAAAQANASKMKANS